MKTSRFESIGMYAPKQAITTGELISQMRNKPEFDLENLTGIRRRRHVEDQESSISISVNAMQDCLANSKYNAEDLDIIIACSISRLDEEKTFIWEPSFGLLLKEAIGAQNAKFYTVSNACAGMGTGVHILNNMIKAGAVSRGMIISGERITVISDTAVNEIKDPIDLQFSSLTVGDSGAAVIMDDQGTDGDVIQYTHFVTMADFSDLCFGMPSEESPGYAMYSDAIGIHREAISRLAPFSRGARIRMEGEGKWDESFNWQVPHQTSIRAMKQGIHAFCDYFDLEPDDFMKTVVSKYIAEYGNTASTSHFVTFHEALKDGMFKKGDKIYFLILASGINIGAIAFQIGDLKVNGQKEV